MAELESKDSFEGSEGSGVSEEVLSSLKNFLVSVAHPILNGSKDAFAASINEEKAQKNIEIFAGDPQKHALVVHKESKGDVETYLFELDIKALSNAQSKALDEDVPSVAFIKSTPKLLDPKKIFSQVQICEIRDKTPLQTILQYVQHYFLPYSQALLKTEEENSDTRALRGVSGKLRELEVELLRSQHRIVIPVIDLELHDLIATHIKSGTTFEEAPGDTLLNELQQVTNNWKVKIREVTSLTRDPAEVREGTALDEIEFWKSKAKSIRHIYDQISSQGVRMTFEVLVRGSRFLATTSFNSDAGLQNDVKSDLTIGLYDIFKEFPIGLILSATTLKMLGDAFPNLFTQLTRIQNLTLDVSKKNIPYTVERLANFISALSRDVVERLKDIFDQHKIMDMKQKAFDDLVSEFQREIIVKWNDQIDTFRKKKDQLKPVSPPIDAPELLQLNERLREISEVRKEHHELKAVISTSLVDDKQTLETIDLAYNYIRIDVLKVSQEEFEAAFKKYKDAIKNVEIELEKEVRSLLSTAKDANEMFRICKKFKALFVRPTIRAALRGFQDKLLTSVHEDIMYLTKMFNEGHEKLLDGQLLAVRLSGIRDVPAYPSKLIWLQQIEKNVKKYEEKIEAILGKKWAEDVAGDRLRVESDNLKSKILEARISLDEKWKSVTEVSKPSGYALIVRRTNKTFLAVNFDTKLATFAKEFRCLKGLGIKPQGKEIKSSASAVIDVIEIREAYPMAVRLEEILRTYYMTCERLANPLVQLLAAGAKKNTQEAFIKFAPSKWDSLESQHGIAHTPGISPSERVFISTLEFHDLVEEIISIDGQTQQALSQLQSSKPDSNKYKLALQEIKDLSEKLMVKKASNIHLWTDHLEKHIEEILIERMEKGLELWINALDPAKVQEEIAKKQKTRKGEDDEESVQFVKASEESEEDGISILDFAIKNPISHRIKIRNSDSVLTVEPPLEQARLFLYQHLQNWLSVFCDLPRLSRKDDFRIILTKIKPGLLSQCFAAIEEKIDAAKQYVEAWLQYQALWDLDINVVMSEFSQDINVWEHLLLDMKKSRANFDDSSGKRNFGPIMIEYASVQEKINDKYNSWHRAVLSKLGGLLGQMIVNLNKTLENARHKLENFSLELGTTKQIVDSLTLLNDIETKFHTWKTDLETQKSVESIFQRQRYHFPADWIFTDRVQGEFNSLEQILNRHLAKLKSEREGVQQRIIQEDNQLNVRIQEFVHEWSERRPVRGDLEYSNVHNTLNLFSGKLKELSEDVQRLAGAKKALQLAVKEETRLKPVSEELVGLQEVWEQLGRCWRVIDEQRQKLFVDVKVLDLRRALNKLAEDVRTLPNHLRQYEAADHLSATIKRYLDQCVMLTDLGSNVLRPKHQKIILQELNIKKSWKDMTIGMLWELNYAQYAKQVRHILDQAQGEGAIEEFLSNLAATWEQTKFDLVDYRGKCYLVRNWDKLFEQLADALSSLASMKNSPFFTAFEQTASDWESKLNRAQAILDVFIDVQRRWVYLEGIFTNSQDVQVQLPQPYKRFVQFDNSFITQMRKIKKNDKVDAWIKGPLLDELQAHAETLNGIQKALSDYLEKQRSAFPRFYFVGDEDLLEIIGNAKNPIKIIRHLPKMFAAIESLVVDGNLLQGMVSSEGETVMFKEPVDVVTYSTIHEWLGQVEYQMRHSLSWLLEEAVNEQSRWARAAGEDELVPDRFFRWVDKYPAQIAFVATQVNWSERVEAILKEGGKGLEDVLKKIMTSLTILADRILLPDLEPDRRKKYEQLITELVHQRDVTRELISKNVSSEKDFTWLGQLRYYFNRSDDAVEAKDGTSTRLEIRISRATFFYGFEYLGVGERLVQTPLTDRCYFTLCEALHMRLGGNPFGPAGTGKTESVKALGTQLGRFVLVFNCDETFDFTAMGRIFVGLCQVGAWGCFDEFNRLEERILSAVSQQILTIQVGLKNYSKQITLLNKPVVLNSNMGIFVTMNPGYAGRSNLPDNLKQLFRGMAMIKPDIRLIAQVMLYSQGFRTAEELSGKIVMLFSLCRDQLSSQPHYDFGLRALKSVLRSAGSLKRGETELLTMKAEGKKKEDDKKEEKKEEAAQDPAPAPVEQDWLTIEQALLVQSLSNTIVPKLVSEDVPLFGTLLTAVFPSAKLQAPNVEKLKQEIKKSCQANKYIDDTRWIDKIMQLNKILNINHGVILVGPSGSGKSSAWKMLRDGLEKSEGIKIESYVIDPKAISKDELYGVLDATTLEWTDGVFTHILRKIIDNVRGENLKKHWIIFDGDVDPEWAENLNSVLDDNKLLTLPNGERLSILPNIRILFEVQNLNHATPATVSRCGMVWFSEEVVSSKMILSNLLERMASDPIELLQSSVSTRWKNVQTLCADVLRPHCGLVEDKKEDDCFIIQAFELARNQEHIMEFTRVRGFTTLFSLLKGGIVKIIEYNDNHIDFPLDEKSISVFMVKYLVFSVVWAFGGSLSLKNRMAFASDLLQFTYLPLPDMKSDKNKNRSLIDFEVRIESQDWELWEDKVDIVTLEPHQVVRSDCVINTIDTIRHNHIISSWLSDHRPLILCGPPGSGKSMTLASVLRTLQDFELVTLNFSSTTTPELVMRTLSHYCKTHKTPHGMVMRPVNATKWLVIFCDEINLPSNDQYETQRIITFLRQLSEQGGFWRAADLSWVTLDRVCFIGACNPPTDAGRVPLSQRFLRHCPLLFVDFPAVPSLRTIYGTFNRALFKLVPALRSYADPITEAMIEVYTASQNRFTPDVQPHYIYSPRELSRWVRAMYEAIKPLANSQNATMILTLEYLVRLWLHEGLRLFQDRLVEPAERSWTDDLVNRVALKHFPTINAQEVLARPVLFSNWLHKDYVPVVQEELRKHVQSRLRVFNEEELDVKLVIFDEVLEHILRIDRVLRQPLGHLLLVGVSGGGKTILSKFCAWMNGMSVFQIKVHKGYKAKDFDNDLRSVLLRSGCKGEKIAFIFDESNVLDTSFLERMNALLASGEVPGLFEGPDYQNLISECKESVRKDGLLIDSEEELYRRFLSQVQYNLHVVFTMNPANDDFDNRAATSPALFNRCVIDWFGEWSASAMFQVGQEFTRTVELGDAADPKFRRDVDSKGGEPCSQREAVGHAIVYVHQSVSQSMQQFAKQHNGRATSVTPRHYLDFLNHYNKLFKEKRSQLEEQQKHLNGGLGKLNETQKEVSRLRTALEEKDKELQKLLKQANEKLDQMMKDKQDAEIKREQSEALAKEIALQEESITKRKDAVEGELAGARPALLEAEQSVRNIKKQDLDQVTHYPNPPAPVKLALEPVLLMLGENIDNWGNMRKAIRKDGFIKSIVTFPIEKLDEKMKQKINKEYISNPGFTYQSVYNASKACGPLVKWVQSTLKFSQIKNSVEPLMMEMKKLEDDQKILRDKMEANDRLRVELGQRIEQYKNDYSQLIEEANKIKGEMLEVKSKVDRSVALLANLESERQRWDRDSKNFQTQIATVPGDCLIASAFIAYVGYFNQSYRQMLINKWSERLKSCGVDIKEDLSVVEYLSHPSERLEWRANSLPVDDLCDENAIMLTKFNRYPLIIDPSGQAITFLMKHCASKKIIRSSFMDDAFLKHLESALRFGNALLVEDVENIDPVLNSVLNREVTRSGGRVMITVGDKEIDFSPSFVIYLSTRDPTCHFTPDLCSRVTFVNFTVTPASLSSQCLSKVLKAERPDIDQKRSDLLKLQGEFRVRLRKLEDSLLDALSGGKGKSILEDEKVLSTLEQLKSEAAEIQQKMDDSEKVMDEITAVSAVYRPFAVSCSSIYFALEKLADAHFLYQFSLPFFLNIIDKILGGGLPGLSEEKSSSKRLQILAKTLFNNTYIRVARALLIKDQVAFGLRLAQIALDEAAPLLDIPDTKVEAGEDSSRKRLDALELDFLIKGKVHITGSKHASIPSEIEGKLSTQQKSLLNDLLSLPTLSSLERHLSESTASWVDFLDTAKALQAQDSKGGKDQDSKELTPTGWENTPLKPHKIFRQTLVAKVFRPDLVPDLAASFVSSVFGSHFLREAQDLNLTKIVQREADAHTPFLLVSRPGFDASSKVDALAKELGIQNYVAIAMGSPEGFEQADAAIAESVKKGHWVLLKNVHLSPSWLKALEKRLHRMTRHPKFLLFMTMEMNPKVPASLLRMSNIIIFEPPVGMKSSLTRIFNGIESKRADKAPVERSRLYFLMAWLHAVVVERLRYAPVGWTKGFEFSESDMQCALDALDDWVDRTAAGRANLAPDKIPWDALRGLFEQVVYGGRIDNDFDQSRLSAFVKSLFTTRAYDLDFALCSAYKEEGGFQPLLTIPEGKTFDSFRKWIEEMPDIQNPEMLGLPANAELMLLTRQGRHLSKQLLVLQEESHDSAELDEENQDKKSSGDAKALRPAWMDLIQTQVEDWISKLPLGFDPPSTGKNLEKLVQNPIYRCMSREYAIWARKLSNVKSDLHAMKSVLEGKTKADNHIRSLFKSLRRDMLPDAWKKGLFGREVKELSPIEFILDLGKRVSTLKDVQKSTGEGSTQQYSNTPIWLGGLQSPEALVAATRQAIAREHGWSLEQLHLKVTVGDSSDNKDSFTFYGLRLQGAEWKDNALAITNTKDKSVLPAVRFTWYLQEGKPAEVEELTTIPVYLDATRQDFLFSVKLPRPNNVPETVWSQRGTCITVYTYGD